MNGQKIDKDKIDAISVLSKAGFTTGLIVKLIGVTANTVRKYANK